MYTDGEPTRKSSTDFHLPSLLKTAPCLPLLPFQRKARRVARACGAIAIQAWWRATRAQRRFRGVVLHVRHNVRLANAARLLQRCWRGTVARRLFKVRKLFVSQRHGAATKIMSWWRGPIARRLESWQVRRLTGCVLFQTAWRGYQIRAIPEEGTTAAEWFWFCKRRAARRFRACVLLHSAVRRLRAKVARRKLMERRRNDAAGSLRW